MIINKSTINLKKLFSCNSIQTINYYLENKKKSKYYIKKSSIHNFLFDIDDSDSGYISQGKCGVVRKGHVLSSDGSIKHIFFKIFISSIYNTIDLDEIKYAIELNKLSPDSVIKLECIEKCNFFKFNTPKVIKSDSSIVEKIESGLDLGEAGRRAVEEVINDKKELIILGMEKGKSDLNSYLINVQNDLYEFERILSLSLDACDSVNRCGYFHRDIKPSNIVIVNRNEINVPVLIDFGYMCYMSNIDGKYNLSDKNPPLDSFYLALHILHKFDDLEEASSEGGDPEAASFDRSHVSAVRNLCLYYSFKFYRIVKFYIPDDFQIKNINKIFFNHYFNNPIDSDYFENVFLKYFKKQTSIQNLSLSEVDILKYIHNRVTNETDRFSAVEIKGYNDFSSLFKILYNQVQTKI